MTKDKIALTMEERAALEQFVAVGKAAARKLTHARILLLADTSGPEQTDQEIADALGTSLPTISRVRQRFVTQGIDAAVNPRPQPPIGTPTVSPHPRDGGSCACGSVTSATGRRTW